jgi:hypothetical protein
MKEGREGEGEGEGEGEREGGKEERRKEGRKPITSIRNERKDITIDSADIKKIRKYYV